MLDISIENVTKVLTSTTKVEKFLTTESVVEEKVDGTKLTLLRNNKAYDPNDFAGNFILAYKGTIIYEEDNIAILEKNAKRRSIGNAQYMLIYEHLKNSHYRLNKIPKNTELFMEFVMEKPTLTRDYEVKHRAVLIGYSKSSFYEEGGKLYTEPGEMQTAKVEEYARLLRVDAPRVIIKGKMFPYDTLALSACDPLFFELLLKNQNRFFEEDGTQLSVDQYYESLIDLFLELKSRYGGLIEGVIVKQGETLLKILQPDQHDKEVRKRKKERYQMSTEREAMYFMGMKSLAREWLDNAYDSEIVFLKNGMMKHPQSFKDRLKTLSYTAYQTPSVIGYFPHHDKKSLFQKQEDFHYLLKYLFLKDLTVNNNAIFIGRMQPPSKMHIQIIRQGLQNYHRVVVAIVKGKKSAHDLNPFSFETQEEMIRAAFPGEKNIDIIQVSTGNLFTAMQKSKRNVNAVLCGEDRKEGYIAQLSQNPEIRVVTFNREKDSVSGTKLREALKNDDKQTFEKNIDKNLTKFYDKLRTEICKK